MTRVAYKVDVVCPTCRRVLFTATSDRPIHAYAPCPVHRHHETRSERSETPIVRQDA